MNQAFYLNNDEYLAVLNSQLGLESLVEENLSKSFSSSFIWSLDEEDRIEDCGNIIKELRTGDSYEPFSSRDRLGRCRQDIDVRRPLTETSLGFHILSNENLVIFDADITEGYIMLGNVRRLLAAQAVNTPLVDLVRSAPFLRMLALTSVFS